VPRSIAAFGAALSLIPCLSHADVGDLSGLYLGVNSGRERNKFDPGAYDAQLVAGADPYVVSFEDRSVRRLANLWWADGGYFFNPYIAVEIAFLHLGRFEYQSTGSIALPSKAEEFYAASDITSRGPAVSLVGRLPLTSSLEFDVRLGDYVGRTESLIALATGPVTSVSRTSQTSSSLIGGAGIGYVLSTNWSLRADYLRVNKTGNGDTGKFSIDVLSAGVSFTF
jgi:hypothetical protein